ncbi:MAG: histone deacetylase, partial [Epulopiscium sp.]|nr:histone deacetylase [Candidatus Epulonipiscium sp.]
WKDRHILRSQKFKGLEYVERPRQIYYDTDGILEKQVQKFTICKKCSGLNTIKSQSDTGYDVLAITIPRDACSHCIDEGYRLYKNTPSDDFKRVYLQDRVEDAFYSKGIKF